MRPTLRTRHLVLIATALATLVEALPAARPYAADLAGLWLVFGAPVAVWYGCAARVVSTKEAAALVALSFGLITDMLALLGLNELLPLFGNEHPLAARPVAATLAGVVILLGAALPEASAGSAAPVGAADHEATASDGTEQPREEEPPTEPDADSPVAEDGPAPQEQEEVEEPEEAEEPEQAEDAGEDAAGAADGDDDGDDSEEPEETGPDTPEPDEPAAKAGAEPAGAAGPARWRMSRKEVLGIGGAGALCLVLSVAGPIRLNNGFSSDVSLAGMVCVTALAVWLLARSSLTLPAVEVGLYCAALALLLLTSLRGWSITGHDIQREYAYFELAYGREHWDVRAFSNPYNACLSITLLPEAVARLTSISGVGVFKVLIPMLFATAPVMIFRATRNVASHRIAVLSALFFIMFPTYFTDMPYEGRQEVAFVVLGSALLLVTERRRALPVRRAAFLALMVGLVISHYSTTYVFLIVLAVAVAADVCWRLGTRIRTRNRRRRAHTSRKAVAREREPGFATWWMVPIVAGLALLWAGPVTDTGGQLRTTLTAAYRELSGVDDGQAGSSSVSYSLLGGTTESDAQRLVDYGDQERAAAQAAQNAGQLLPQSMVDQYTTPLAPPDELPLTRVGKQLQSRGVDVLKANTLLRNGAADLMQVLILLGLLAMWLRRRKGFEPLRDHVTLTLGALAMLAALTLVPQLSIDYSVLRGFQQGIFFFAPFMALGLTWLLSWLRRFAFPAVCVVTTALLLDLSGAVPRVTGGYPPQLSLSNSGQYYDIYDPSLSEQQAAAWLENRVYASKDPSQVLIQSDFYTYFRLQTTLNTKVYATIYPATLNKDAYIFLGTATVQKGEVTVFYSGDLVTYYYPVGLLNRAYNEVFAGSGAEVFQ